MIRHTPKAKKGVGRQRAKAVRHKRAQEPLLKWRDNLLSYELYGRSRLLHSGAQVVGALERELDDVQVDDQGRLLEVEPVS